MLSTLFTYHCSDMVSLGTFVTRTYHSESRGSLEINSLIVLNLNNFFKGGQGEANPEDPADLVVESEHGRG